MKKFLHTADLHLGSPLASLPENVAKVLREELFETLSRIIELARDEQVDALLISGDLFDEPSPTRAVSARAFELLGRAGLPVFISPGNHDYVSARSPYRLSELPQNVHVFMSERIEKVDCGDFDVYGAGFASSTVATQLLKGFRADGGKPSVMVLHGETEVSSAQYHPIAVADIAASGLDYLALGHIHMRSAPAIAGKTVFAYSGNPMGRSFDKQSEKGVYLVEIDGETRVRFIPLGARRFVTIESENASIPDGFERDLVRLVLTGEGEPADVESLERELSERAFYVKVVDRTRLPRRIWERANEDTLAGQFISALASMREKGADEELVDMAARYGIAALDGEEAPL